MTLPEIIGLNVKWYRYQNRLTQAQYANKINFKVAYLSVVESGKVNLTCKNISLLAKSFCIPPELLLNEENAKLAKNLPSRLNCMKNEGRKGGLKICIDN